MPRSITINELDAARNISAAARRWMDEGYFFHTTYEKDIDRLIALARPEMLAAWQQAQEPALFSHLDPAGDGATRIYHGPIPNPETPFARQEQGE